eukprot:GFYU01006386.1.p1 GENE.GFYU01006386.1~~GFYU01006386.1.p1  ORF type:complete len:627 (-),score=176.17 GFYU01006386.1:584-2464(-)
MNRSMTVGALLVMVAVTCCLIPATADPEVVAKDLREHPLYKSAKPPMPGFRIHSIYDFHAAEKDAADESEGVIYKYERNLREDIDDLEDNLAVDTDDIDDNDDVAGVDDNDKTHAVDTKTGGDDSHNTIHHGRSHSTTAATKALTPEEIEKLIAARPAPYLDEEYRPTPSFLVNLCEQAYPEEYRMTALERDESLHTSLAKFFRIDMADYGSLSQKTYFSGNCQHDSSCIANRKTTAGISAILWTTEPGTSKDKELAVIAFRGTYTDYDFLVEEVWFKDWLAHHQRQRAIDEWRELGRDLSELDLESHTSAAWTEMEWNLKEDSVRANIAQQLSGTGLPADELQSQLYWGPAKKMFKEMWYYVQQYDRRHMTGHGLGGSVAHLLSAWWNEQHDLELEVTSFNSPGVQCMAKKQLGLNMDRVFSTSRNYANQYDVVSMFDHQMGQQCRYKYSNEEGITACAKVFGQGLSLFNKGTKVNADFMVCRDYVHDLSHILTSSENKSYYSVLEQAQCVDPRTAECPDAPVNEDLVLLIVGFVFLGIYAAFMVFWVIPRFIYIRQKGEGDLFPFPFCGPEVSDKRSAVRQRVSLGKRLGGSTSYARSTVRSPREFGVVRGGGSSRGAVTKFGR